MGVFSSSGVVQKSPADKAGLKEEDVVIEFKGREIPRMQGISPDLIENAQPDKPIKLKVRP